jgi:hypothetical protein
MQKTGLEWAFRLMQEPRRLFSRYARNAGFLGSMILHDLFHKPDPRAAGAARPAAVEPSHRRG